MLSPGSLWVHGNNWIDAPTQKEKHAMPSSLILPVSPAHSAVSRRRLLKGTGTATLSAVAISLLAGCDSMAASKQMAANPGGDVDILNSA
ncbi:MAG TPA: twin-arginine translocation signal domain-containing protein, partial [Stellaceae bacterium]